MSSVITILEPDPTGAGDTMFFAGEVAKDLLFIAKGGACDMRGWVVTPEEVEILSPSGELLAVLTDGSYIGGAPAFSRDLTSDRGGDVV